MECVRHCVGHFEYTVLFNHHNYLKVEIITSFDL